MLYSITLVVALVSTVQGEFCNFNLQTDLDSKYEPLILAVNGKNLDFVWPETVSTTGVLRLEDGDQLLLACTGRRNFVREIGTQSASVTCTEGVLSIEGKAVSSATTSCTKQYADSSMTVSRTPCGSGDNTGVILHLGFELEDESFHPLVEICHNVDKAVSYYAKHQLYGASIRGGVKSSERRGFSRGSIFSGVNPDKVYVKSGQIKAFNNILGPDSAKRYINSSSFLARGHLAPDADFIYNSGQLMTYWYANVAPQWQSFNGGNWASVESTTRTIAAKFSTTLDVVTGTYGVLELANSSGELNPIYLDPKNNLIPVPLVFWKLLHNPKTNSCLVVVGHNNPFLTSNPDTICNTVVPKGFPNLTTNLKKGYTYFCDYDSFKEVVDYAPEMECSGIFQF